jgi:hypothetical protein
MMRTEALRRAVAIDFLYLDLEVCTRCRGTDSNRVNGRDSALELRESRCESGA